MHARQRLYPALIASSGKTIGLFLGPSNRRRQLITSPVRSLVTSWQTRWADSMLIVTLSSWEFPCVSQSVIRKGGLIGGILTAMGIARGVEHDHCPRASS